VERLAVAARGILIRAGAQGKRLDVPQDGPYRSQAAFDAIAARCSTAQVGLENETKAISDRLIWLTQIGLSIGLALGPWQAVGT